MTTERQEKAKPTDRVLMERNARAAIYHARGGPRNWAPEYRSRMAGEHARMAVTYARELQEATP